MYASSVSLAAQYIIVTADMLGVGSSKPGGAEHLSSTLTHSAPVVSSTKPLTGQYIPSITWSLISAPCFTVRSTHTGGTRVGPTWRALSK